MRTAALAALGPALVLAGLALAAALPSRSATAFCRQETGRPVAGEARELPAGAGIWSLWIRYPPRAGAVTTVLWRAERARDNLLGLVGRDREGRTLAIEFGPSPVLPQLGGGGLPWERPGREWGTRLLFPAPGCWRLSAAVGARRGALAVWVEP